MTPGELDGEGPGRRDRLGEHRVVVPADVVHASPSRVYAAQEGRVLLLGPAVGEVAFHEHRVGVERLDRVDGAARSSTSGYGSSPGSAREHGTEFLRRSEQAALDLAEVHVVHRRDRREQPAGRAAQAS